MRHRLASLLIGLSLLTAAPLMAMAAEEPNFNPGWERVDAAFARKDYAGGRRIAEELAAKGHPEAINGLAAFLNQGIGGPVDHQRARTLLEKAAGLGSLSAKLNLGRELAFDDDRSQWPRASAYLREAVADPEFARLAYYPLGRILMFGGTGQADLREGADYMIKAADLEVGNADAQFLAFRALQNGWGGLARDEKRAMAYLLKSGELEDPRGLRFIAMARLEGAGLPKDPAAALVDFKAAADKGNVMAMNDVAVMLAIGEGVSADPREALRWYLKAAEKGSAQGLRGLGGMFYNGEGGLQDRVTGRALLELSAVAGDPQAIKVVGGFGEVSGSDRAAIERVKVDWLKTHPKPEKD